MAVTDLTGAQPFQGGGSGAGGLPGGGDSASWLQYLSQMFGISPSQAMTMMQSGANPANMPSPDASNMRVSAPNDEGHGDGDNPPVSPFPAPPAGPVAAQPGPTTGPAGPVANLPRPLAANFPPPAAGPMPARPAGVSASGLPLQPGSLAPGALDQFASAGGGPIGSGGYVPWPSGGGSMSPTADVPAPAAQPVSAAAPAARVAGPLAASNRFVGIDRPNADPTRRSGPQGTALNLAGLFGGGQPAVNPNVPAAAAQPVSAVRGPLAQGGLSKAPWGMGPLQPGMVWPKDMGPFKPRSSSGYGDPRVWG